MSDPRENRAGSQPAAALRRYQSVFHRPAVGEAVAANGGGTRLRGTGCDLATAGGRAETYSIWPVWRPTCMHRLDGDVPWTPFDPAYHRFMTASMAAGTPLFHLDQ